MATFLVDQHNSITSIIPICTSTMTYNEQVRNMNISRLNMI